MTIRLDRPRPLDLPVVLPQVLLALEQIRDRAMEPERRLAMLRALKDQVEQIQAALPPRRSTDRDWCAPPAAPSQEERLNRAWCGNLQHLLRDLGHPRSVGQARFAVYREWVLRQLLKDLGRAAEASVRAQVHAAPGTWQGLHDLFVYLDGRDELAGAAAPGPRRFNPGNEYKRLLLLGALDDYTDAARILAELGPRLRDWAAAAVLRRDVRVVGESALLRLDPSKDAPPYRARPGDDQPYHGWVLEPPAAYSGALNLYPLAERRLLAAA